MKAFARFVAPVSVIFLGSSGALTGRAVPLHGETVRAGRERTTLPGKIERVQGNQAVDIRSEDGSLLRVRFASRFAHITAHEGRPLSAGMLHQGQPVSVTGSRRGQTVWADRMEVK